MGGPLGMSGGAWEGYPSMGGNVLVHSVRATTKLVLRQIEGNRAQEEWWSLGGNGSSPGVRIVEELI